MRPIAFFSTVAPRPSPTGVRIDLTADRRREAFLAALARMSPSERLRAARFSFDRSQRDVLVAESAVIGGDPAEFSSSRRLKDAGNVHTYERRRLLYDHLQRLQDLAASAGDSLAVDDVEAAVFQLEAGVASR